jgi:hypothetical protein
MITLDHRQEFISAAGESGRQNISSTKTGGVKVLD